MTEGEAKSGEGGRPVAFYGGFDPEKKGPIDVHAVLGRISSVA